MQKLAGNSSLHVGPIVKWYMDPKLCYQMVLHCSLQHWNCSATCIHYPYMYKFQYEWLPVIKGFVESTDHKTKYLNCLEYYRRIATWTFYITRVTGGQNYITSCIILHKQQTLRIKWRQSHHLDQNYPMIKYIFVSNSSDNIEFTSKVDINIYIVYQFNTL